MPFSSAIKVRDPADPVQAPATRFARQKGYRVFTNWDEVSQLLVPVYGDAEPLVGGTDKSPYVQLQNRLRGWDDELIRSQVKILQAASGASGVGGGI